MSFDTVSFWIIFLPLVLIYWIIPTRMMRNSFLLLTSYGIYASFDYRFLIFIFISTAVDYSVSLVIGRSSQTWVKKMALALSLSTNLGLLFSFKYLLNLFGHSTLAHYAGEALPNLLADIGLPLGISFYTFQTLSYTIDVYRGRIRATTNLIDFALYVSFFPQLTAGPIEKARRFLPQIQRDRPLTTRGWREGVVLILLGLVKKIYVADSLGVAIDFVFKKSKTINLV